MATVSILRLTPQDFVIYRDSISFVGELLSHVTDDWTEYQEHVQQDAEVQSFYSEEAHEYAKKITPLWTAFLQTPMFEVMVETPDAPVSDIRRTVASVMNRVQAREWMLPLSKEDCEVH